MVIARNMVGRFLYVGPPLVVLFALLRGWDGAWSSALGVAIVIGNFLLAGAILSISVRISLSAYHAAALFGFVLRLGLIIATMLLIASLLPVDRVAFGVTAVIAYLTLLSLEAVAISRGRERNLDWIS
jgi:hypothetical protein